MFKRNSLPQRKKFSLQADEIKEDIEAVYNSEEQRNMLYHCLDEKPPQDEYKLAKMEEFLTGSNNLENVHRTLKTLIDKIEKLTKDISEKVGEIKSRTDDIKVTRMS